MSIYSHTRPGLIFLLSQQGMVSWKTWKIRMGRMWCELNCSTGWKNSKIDKDRRKSVISSGAKSFSLTIDITKTTHSNMLLSRDSENLKIFQVLKIDYYNICLRNSLPTLKSFIKITQHQNLRQRFYAKSNKIKAQLFK